MPLNLRDFLAVLGDDLIRVDDEIDPITQAGALCSAAPRPIMLSRLKGFPGWSLCDILVKDRARQAKALVPRPATSCASSPSACSRACRAARRSCPTAPARR